MDKESMEELLMDKDELTEEEFAKIEENMASFLVKIRDQLPEDSDMRHLINFNFAGIALHDSLTQKGKMKSAATLSRFMRMFVRIHAGETLDQP